MTDQLYCPKCGPDWHGAYDMNHRCVECGEALKAEKVMEKLKALEEERDALLAQVERLRAATDAALAEIVTNSDGNLSDSIREALLVIDESPATSLARLKADILMEWSEKLKDGTPMEDTVDAMADAAKQLRQASEQP